MKLKLMRETGKIRLALFRAPARIAALVICLAAVPVLSGCSLALEDVSTGKDRLAGVFVTRNYIEPGLPSLEVNSRGEIVAKDTGPEKIYGCCSSSAESSSVVIFPGLEGYGIYNLQISEEEAQAPARYGTCDFPFSNLHFNVSDEEESMEADLCVPTAVSARYYFNPVYQQEDGQIYLLAGSGVSTDSFVDGQKLGHSISESVSRTENGEQSSQTMRFTINIVAAVPPRETELFLMNQENRPLACLSDEQLETLSETGEPLVLPADVSYLVLRQSMPGDQPDIHSLFDRSHSSLEYLTPAEDGYLGYCSVALEWP